jgi:cell wall-associated NlpC family hydrolase
MRTFSRDSSTAIFVLALLTLAPASLRAQSTQFDNFVYVNQNAGAPGSLNYVSGYGFDPNQGLVPLPNSPFPTKGIGPNSPTLAPLNFPIDIAVGRDFGYVRNPAGNLLFVSNLGSNDISVFSIDPLTGNLSLTNGSPVSTGIPPGFMHALALTPDTGTDQAGNRYRFLYSANYSGASTNNQVASSISAYRVDPNGALTFLYNRDVRAMDGGSLTGPIRISPNGKFLAVSGIFCSASPYPGDVVIYRINDDPTGIHDGGLTKVSCFSTATANNVAIKGFEFDCTNARLFVAGLGVDALGLYSPVGFLNIDPSSGALSQSSGFVRSTGFSAASPLLSPGETVLAYTAFDLDEVRTFHVVPSIMEVADTSRVNSNGIQVTVKGSPYSDPGVPSGLATDEAGMLLYTANVGGTGQIAAFNMAPGGFLTQVPAGSFVSIPYATVSHVVAFPPKNCSIRSIPETAAARAKSLLNLPYFFGAKGYDKGAIPNGYAGREAISSGYTHCDGSDFCSKTTREPGIDCAGLVLWSYNTGDGFWKTYTSGVSPIQSEGADGQYTDSAFLNSADHFDQKLLEPGDLLFFNYEHKFGKYNLPVFADHVAMYVGATARNQQGEVVEAYYPGIGVIPSSCDPTGTFDPTNNLGCERARYDHKYSGGTALPECGKETNYGSWPTPCFAGFKRPINTNTSIWFNTHSPIGLIVTDPEGFTITPETVIVTSREAMRIVPGQLSYVINSDDDDTVIAHTLKPGVYLVKPVPKPNALPGDTYSLTVTGAGTTLTLAQNVPISEIPSQGYAVASTGSAISEVQGPQDTIPPITTATLSPQPNAAGWNNVNVTVALNSTDNEPGGSGVKQITYSTSGAQALANTTVNAGSISIIISTEGTTTVSFSAADNAGNIETLKQIVVMLDKSSPTTTGTRTPAPNSSGWNNSNVSVGFTCADSLSGLAPGSPQALTLLSSEGANQSVTGSCQDLAGNSATATVSAINIDKTPPILTVTTNPPANANGWNNTNVTVSFAALDALSGVGVVSGPVTVTSEGASQLVSGSAIDLAGNLAPGSVVVNLDKTPPEVFNQFDPVNKDIVLFGRDSLSGVMPGPIQPASVVSLGRDDEADDMGCPDGNDVRAELRTYRVLDLAGNPVTMVEKVKRRGQLLRAKFISIQYAGGAVTALPKNRESFDWTLSKDGSLKELDQEFRIAPSWDGSGVEADFDARSNKTTILKEFPKPKTKIVTPGLDLVRMATAAGKLSIEF